MIIKRFNESADIDVILSEFKMTTKSFDDILERLTKYRSNLTEDVDSLIKDIQREKNSNWSKLRKWKIESIISRYKEAMKLVESIEEIEDILLEVEDNGWKYEIIINQNKIHFTAKDSPIKKINSLFNFLSSSHKFGFKMDMISFNKSRKSVDVVVIYKIKTTDWSEDHEPSMDDKFRFMAQKEEDDE